MIAGLLIALAVKPMAAETFRIATYNAELSDFGPGLLWQDLQHANDPQREAAIAVIERLDADILVLTGIDYDLRGDALGALAARLAENGTMYPYHLALRPNTGVATGLDIDGNGKLGEPRDAMGYGRFAGEGGMAILSRLPIDAGGARDFSGFLWADLPGNLMPADDPARGIQRLSTTGHWEVPITLPNQKTLRILAYYATPPVFGGPEDRNGRRNHDEAAFWLHLLNGTLPMPAPLPPFVLLGQTSLDPFDGAGRSGALRALMRHSTVQEVAPKGTHGRKEQEHAGDTALDTALYDGIGGLRVEQILPSADLVVSEAGVLWPPTTDPFFGVLTTASRHFPLWVDIELP